MSTLERALSSGPQEQLLVAWILTHEHRTAECTVWSHPFGWELRVAVNRSTIETQLSRSSEHVMQIAATWKQIFEGAGWSNQSE
jgi:hypothetical protein